jgi:hypothetical protein
MSPQALTGGIHGKTVVISRVLNFNPELPPAPRWRGSPLGLHQLDAVTERVCDVQPKVTLERVFNYLDVGLTQAFDQSRQSAHEESGMSLPGRSKVGFDSEMDLYRTPLEPRAAPFGQFRRLRNLRNAE